MNAVTTIPTYNPQLPDFLQLPDLFNSSTALTGGISSGSQPQIGIAGAKWALLEANGEKLYVQQMHLDVIVLGANEHISKNYYTTKFDPNNPAPPDCFSDNGKAPSSQAQSPQSPTCASCKWAAFGSKISETGSEIKACGDQKKLAVVLAAPTPCVINGAAETVQPFEQIYLLRVPAMSLRQGKAGATGATGQPWREYATDIVKRRLPMQGVITRMAFDPTVNYPKITFAPVTMVSDKAVFDCYATLIGSAEMREIVGADDLPFAGAAEMSKQANSRPTNLQGADSAPSANAATPPSTPPAAASTPAPAPAAQAAAPATAGTGRLRGRPARQQNAKVAAAVTQAEQTFAPPIATAQNPFAAPFAAPAQQAAPPVQNGAIQQATAAPPELDAMLAKLFE